MSTHCPFNGDKFIGIEIRKLVERFGIKTIVETGTWSAVSTRAFKEMVPHVITIDSTHEHLIEEFGPRAVNDLIDLGIHPVLGDSATDLSVTVNSRRKHRLSVPPFLFYLDAHYGGANGSNVNPLMEELKQIPHISDCKDNCVIAIHDFKVPGKPWGCNGGDWGNGYEHYSYALIYPFLPAIYPKGYDFHYNEEAEGCQRGIIYLYPRR